MNKIAIVTVNYNGKKNTLELLTSLKKFQIVSKETAFGRTNFKFQIKTIVVDNGSTDGSVSAIKTQYPEVDILQNGENKGFAGGYNRGIDYALIWGADYVLIINNDCLIKDGNLLDELIKTSQSDPKIGLSSPKIYFAAGFEFHKDRYSAKDQGRVIWYAGGHFDWNNIHAVHRGLDEVDHGQYDKIEEVDFISGACMLIKREVIEKIGLFDEQYFLYFEDADLQKRVKDGGFELFYNGKVCIYHKVSQSTGIGSTITDYYHTRNRLIFGMKYGKFRTKFALLREAIKLFIFGRPAQRRGVLDFYLGVRFRCDQNLGTTSTKVRPEQAQYPLKLSIIIVSYNTADLTRKLLQSIFKKESGFDPKSMEVLVLDNGSADNCKKVIKDYLLASLRGRSGPKIKFLQNKKNEGFSKGYNKLIRFSKGEYFLMFNSDIEVLRNSLSEMVKWADYFKGEAVLGGKLVFPDGSNQDSAFHLPTITGAFKEYFFQEKGFYFMSLPKGDEGGKGDWRDQPIKVEGLVMACFLIPWKIINKVGLLDEGTFIFFEDIEYARRLKKYGVPLYFIPSAKFIHQHGGATKRIGQDKAYDLLKTASIRYHGFFTYIVLSFILWLGQKLGRVKTPISRWTKS